MEMEKILTALKELVTLMKPKVTVNVSYCDHRTEKDESTYVENAVVEDCDHEVCTDQNCNCTCHLKE